MGRFGGGLLGADLAGDIAGELDHLVQAPAGVEDRVVGSLQVDHLPQFVDPFKTVGMVLATVERRPECLVGR
ncbi:hypothetical protein D3C85_1425940 [compost metagenome]